MGRTGLDLRLEGGAGEAGILQAETSVTGRVVWLPRMVFYSGCPAHVFKKLRTCMCLSKGQSWVPVWQMCRA